MSDQVYSASRVRVLLVDDEKSLREPLTDFLQKYYTVEPASSGAEAFALVEKYQGNFDVALIDESLIPGPDGIEVMKQIRARYPNIEAIIFTGWGAEQREIALRAGAIRYLEKPFNKEELVLLIRNCAQQVRFNSINQEMLASRGLDGLQSAIIRSACSLAFADDAAIVFRNPALGRIDIRRSSEAEADICKFARHLNGVHLTDQIMQVGEIVSIPDTLADPRVDPRLLEAGFQSFIGLPIPGETAAQGVLYVYSRSPHHFDELGNTTLLRTVAVQAGLALTNAAAEELLAMHNRYMAALVHASRELSAARRQPELFDIAWQFVKDELGLSIFFIALYDPQSEMIHFPIFMDQGVPLDELPRKLDGRETWGVTGYVIRENREILWATLADEEKFRSENQIGINVIGVRAKSCFFYPLVFEGQAIGVISVQSQHENGMTPAYLAALRALGNHLSVAIENIRLQEEEKQRRLEVEALYRSTQAVSKSIEPQQVIHQLLKTMSNMVPFDSATIQMIREIGGQIVFELIDGSGFSNIEELVGKMYPVHNRQSYAQVYESKQTVIIPNIQTGSLSATSPLEGTCRSWMGVPLVADNEIIGLVTLNSLTANFYTPQHARLAEMFASGVSQAVQNALYHEQIEHSRRMLEAVTEASQYIRSESEPHRLLFEIVHQACELLGFSYGALFYCNPFVQEIELTVSYNLPEKLNGTRYSAASSLAGQVALTGQREFFSGPYARRFPKDDLLAGLEIQSALAIPIQHRNDVATQRVLLLVDPKPQPVSKGDMEVLEKLSDQAAIAIQTSSFLSDGINRYNHLTILQKINEFIQSRRKLDDILHLVLTGITAGYGLGFNRAVLLFIDRSGGSFVGQMAIGCQDLKQSRIDWDESRKAGLNNFANYLALLNAGKLQPTPLHHVIAKQVFEVAQGSAEDLVEKVRTQGMRLKPDDLDPLPGFMEVFKPTGTMLAVPVQVSDEVVGLLIVDNKFNLAPISTESESSLITFVNVAGLAIRNDRLLTRLQRTRDAALEVNKVSVLGNLKQSLETITKSARRVLDCDMFTLYIYDPKSRKFTGLEHYGCLDTSNIRPAEKLLETSTPYKIINLAKQNYYSTEESMGDTFITGDFAKKEKIRTTLAIKLIYQDHPVGVLFINYRRSLHLTDDDINTALLFADEAAIAIQNALLYSQTERQALHLKELYEAGKLITSSLSLEETLKYLAERARRLMGVEGEPGLFCNVLLEDKGILRFAASAPEGIMSGLREFDPHQSPCGLFGQAFLTGKPHLAKDVSKHPEYIEFNPTTRSELAVPLAIENKVIGVINVESQEVSYFNKQDQLNLELLAAQATIAIQNARSYDELRKAQGIIGSRTALAWTGMNASVWRHSIEKDALTIRDSAGLLLKNPKTKVVERAEMIQRLASQILNKRISTPLSSEEGIELIPINQLVKERVKQLWERPHYPPAQYELRFELGDDQLVLASPEWLRRALEILIENSVREVKQCPDKTVTIGTRPVNLDQMEIFVIDYGRGIPPEIWEQLGELMPNTTGKDSMGIGLMMAQIIVSTYNGSLVKIRSDTTGTELALRFPCSEVEVRIMDDDQQ